MHTETDEDLMQQVKATSDRDAFTALVMRHKQRAYLLALKLTGSHDDAMDASQESFVKIFRKAATYQDGARFTPWLLRIVRNTAFNLNRSRRRRRQVGADELLAYIPDPVADTASAARQAELWRVILALPEHLREVVVLRHHEGLDYAAIAEVLELPSGTVATRLHQARKELERRYDMS